MRWKSGVIGLIFLIFSFAANSTPIQFQFTVNADSGPLAGISSSGSFSIDDSIIPAGGTGFLHAAGLLTQLDFTWNGIHYTSLFPLDNPVTLDFRHGALHAAQFGVDSLGVPACGSSFMVEAWCVYVVGGLPGFFFYSMGGPPFGQGGGTTVATGLIALAEPSTWMLLAVAGLVFGVTLRCRRSPS